MSYCINPKCLDRHNPDNGKTCQACGTSLLIKERYRLLQPLRELDERGHTEIFEVDDRGTRKVLKVLIDNRPKWVELFKREAKQLKELKHPGIPKVDEDGDFIFPSPKLGPKGLPCLVMEKIEGQNLEQWLEKHGPITQELALQWLRQLAEILKQVHQKWLLHRDIKLSNIMLRPNGQLVLIDFGTVGEHTGAHHDRIRSGRGEDTGIISPGYTPPEQVIGRPSRESDFYALGCSFVHLLTGIHPIDLPEDKGKLIWRDKAPKVSKALANLIDDLMAPLADSRPPTAQIILERLTELDKPLLLLKRFIQAFSLRSWKIFNLVLFIILLSTGWNYWRRLHPENQPSSDQYSSDKQQPRKPVTFVKPSFSPPSHP